MRRESIEREALARNGNSSRDDPETTTTTVVADSNVMPDDQVQAALFDIAARTARNAGVELTVSSDSSIEELQAFIDRTMPMRQAVEAQAVAITGPLTADDRRRLFETIPNYGKITAPEIVEAGRRGFQGEAAIIAAAKSTTASPVARAREARPASRRGSGSSASRSGDPPLGDDRPRSPRPLAHCAERSSLLARYPTRSPAAVVHAPLGGAGAARTYPISATAPRERSRCDHSWKESYVMTTIVLPTLPALVRHVQKFGPECVLETASRYLDEDELVLLRVEIDSTSRRVRRRGPTEIAKAVHLLRSKGLGRAAIADKLRLPDRTVRRYLNGGGTVENGPANPHGYAAGSALNANLDTGVLRSVQGLSGAPTASCEGRAA